MNSCIRCGYCCTLRVKISFIEYIRILAKRYKDFSEKNANDERCIKIVEGKCFFLGNKGGTAFCRIYDQRPKMCREYPGVDVCPKAKERQEEEGSDQRLG